MLRCLCFYLPIFSDKDKIHRNILYILYHCFFAYIDIHNLQTILLQY